MTRHFNTSGLCFPKDHYMLDPLARLQTIEELIGQKKYFSVHAPRQTGKTTAMRTLMDKLNAEGTYISVHFSCEAASVTGANFESGNRIIVERLYERAKRVLPENEWPPQIDPQSHGGRLLQALLTEWASQQRKPLVLLIDEIDSLSDLTLISIMRQLRDGFQDRPLAFPQSIALIGLRDIRDYKVKVRDELQSMGTASPFNIKDESLTLRNFTEDEVRELYEQHNEDTGQPFTEEAVKLAFHYTQGQPWLVNALARECVRAEGKRSTIVSIDEEDVVMAKETLILRRDTHLDSLLSTLKEERVQRILAPILAGELIVFDTLDDDLLYARNLGLVTSEGPLKMANPIYHEVVPRALNTGIQATIPEEYDTWLDNEGKLDWPTIWNRFLEFWKEHGTPLIHFKPFHEIAPHLVLMAYLQRIANAQGQVTREYAIGRKRMDILVRWPYTKAGRRVWQLEAIELKVWKPTDKKDPLEKGLVQLTQYLNGLSLQKGTLVIFDRRDGISDLEDRVTRDFMDHAGKRIQVIRA